MHALYYALHVLCILGRVSLDIKEEFDSWFPLLHKTPRFNEYSWPHNLIQDWQIKREGVLSVGSG